LGAGCRRFKSSRPDHFNKLKRNPSVVILYVYTFMAKDRLQVIPTIPGPNLKNWAES
jgi:hypothetical protein